MRWWMTLLLTLFTFAAAAQMRDPYVHFFQPKLGDLHADLETAKREGKLGVLLMFEMDDCPFCHRMKTQVLNRAEVQDYFRRYFLIYNIDTKGDIPIIDLQGNETSEKAFALAQRARATPVFIFYDLEGRPLARYTGATQTAEEFLLLGRYVVEGAYKTMPFNVYKRQAGR